MKINPLKGMKDYLPDEQRLRDYVQGRILATYRASGFQRISTPMLEDMENLDKSEGGDNLNRQLCPGLEVDNIVHRAHDGYDERAEQQAYNLRGEADKQQHRQHEAQENRNAAHARDGVVVYAPLILGHVHRAYPLRKGFDRRGHKIRHGESHCERQQYPQPNSHILKHLISLR